MFEPRILDLLERLDAAADTAALRLVLVRALEDWGLPHVAYCNLSEFQKTGDLAALQKIMTFPTDWTEYYQSRRYEAIDPVFHAARFRRRPFHWQDLTQPRGEFSARQRGMIAEAAAVGMAHGLTVPLFGPDGEHAIVSVASLDPLEDCPARPSALAAVATQFHMVHQDLTECGTEPDTPPITLFPREREVLLWCARGKTSWEIGRILHLAERTVDHYAADAMTKLDAPNRVAAVLKATRQGLITP
jgi:LuxR family quorum-sensing system transcriptional regulator CciR